MKKMLFVCEYAGFMGGIEQYAFEVATLLRRNGWLVYLLYAQRISGFECFVAAFDDFFALDGAHCVPDCDLTLLHRCSGNQSVDVLSPHNRRNLAAVVHDHDLYCPRRYYYTPFGRCNCDRAYDKVRCTLCGMAISPRRYNWRVGRELLKQTVFFNRRYKLYHELPKLVVLSEYMRGNLERNFFAPERIAKIHPVVPNVPDDAVVVTPGNAFKNGATPQIGFAGQLIRGKGCDTFIRLLAQMKTPLQAVVAGDGNDREMLERLAAELGVKVNFAGYVADMGDFYRQCDFMLLPFRWQEPFGLVGMEAHAHGVAVLAYDVGGVREWLRLNRDECLADAGDMPKLLALAERMASDPAQCRRCGEEARADVRREFSEKAFLQEINRLVESFK